jgi:hypothetical protein
MHTPKTSAAEAVRLLRADHQLLLDRIDGLTEAELRAPYHVTAGPLGHFCDSLHDLTAHGTLFGHAARHLDPAPIPA